MYYIIIMEKVKVQFENRCHDVDRGTSVKDFLNLPEAPEYKDNPVVGAYVNGEFKSLHYTLIYRFTTVEPIHLFSQLGKRVYRHSICFLLSCAAAKLFPDNHLVIGHSLGDGYYFSFTDKDVTDDDITALTGEMKSLVKAAMPVEREKLPYAEALSLFSDHTFRYTSELLETRNEGDITAYTLDGYTDISYEPLVYNTSLLSLWDLRKYENGMLLRYPQSRDFLKLKPFTENPLLFSVFKETEKNDRILKMESLGQLNKCIQNGEEKELIQLSEAMFNAKVRDVASDILAKKKIKAIFIAGPSSSGKTTFSLKLSQQLRISGYEPVKISLDDYYLTRDKVPVDSDGNKDYEALEALDLDFFRDNLTDLLTQGQCHLPHFSFRDNARIMNEQATVMKDNSVLIIEGIHGLNPALAPDLDKDISYRIYISALTSMIIDDHNRISTTDNRIIRRIVRDHRTRGIKTEETLSMWPSVERGEKNYIFPYQNNADVMINSAMPYELAALAPNALNLLRSVKPDTPYAYATARRLLKFLSLVYIIPISQIPEDSITREFLGGSAFGAI